MLQQNYSSEKVIYTSNLVVEYSLFIEHGENQPISHKDKCHALPSLFTTFQRGGLRYIFPAYPSPRYHNIHKSSTYTA
jgi:hypothetical protein